MKTFNDFLSTPPSYRTEMVLEAYELLSSRFYNITSEFDTLNSWMEAMPALIESGKVQLPNDAAWEETFDCYNRMGERLTKAMIDNVKLMEAFSKAVLMRKNSETETI